MKIKVGINGFGRIGRNIFRAGLNNAEIQFVAVNDLPMPTETLAHLLKHDSTFGTLDAKVEAKEGALVINGQELKVLSHKDPAEIPWGKLGVEVVIESTGIFTDATKAKAHLQGGAKFVIISAPAKNEDLTVVIGVNEEKIDVTKHQVISNASCTTNCLAPVAKVLHEKFKIIKGQMTTVHSYTNDQKVLDLPHKDLRRARTASVSIIPTTTGAAKAIGLVLPELKGRLDGMAMRVPTPNVSVVDFVVEVGTDTTKEEVNQAFKDAANGPLSHVLAVSDEPLVSKDYNGNPKSSIVDSALTNVVDKRLVKVISWYDNEWGYSNRCVELAVFVGKRLQGTETKKVGAKT